MRLHCGRQRSLERIEEALAASDPRLASMFAIFKTMTRYEQMPVTERIDGRRRQLLHKAAMFLSTF
jgi:hypothetical protein